MEYVSGVKTTDRNYFNNQGLFISFLKRY